MQAPRRRTQLKSDGPHKKPTLRGGKRGRATALSQGSIAAVALALIDAEGVDALSFRRLGQELGCEAMSLYHYFPSKAHLTDAVIDRVFGELVVPPPNGDWLERLRRSAWNYRAMALKHPRLYPLIAVHRMNTRVGVGKLNEIIGVFREAGFNDALAARLFRAFGYFLTGAALDETAGYAKGPSAATPVSNAEIMEHFPNLAAVAPFFKPQHFEETFSFGLELLLQGIARLKRA